MKVLHVTQTMKKMPHYKQWKCIACIHVFPGSKILKTSKINFFQKYR